MRSLGATTPQGEALLAQLHELIDRVRWDRLERSDRYEVRDLVLLVRLLMADELVRFVESIARTGGIHARIQELAAEVEKAAPDDEREPLL